MAALSSAAVNTICDSFTAASCCTAGLSLASLALSDASIVVAAAGTASSMAVPSVAMSITLLNSDKEGAQV
jgi:hypothetical protein